MQGFSKHITQKQTATSKPPKGSDEESESENIVLSPLISFSRTKIEHQCKQLHTRKNCKCKKATTNSASISFEFAGREVGKEKIVGGYSESMYTVKTTIEGVELERPNT